MAPGTAPASDASARAGAFARPLRTASADVVYLMPPLVIADARSRRLFGAFESMPPR